MAVIAPDPGIGQDRGREIIVVLPYEVERCEKGFRQITGCAQGVSDDPAILEFFPLEQLFDGDSGKG